jgi:hypothetical protein
VCSATATFILKWRPISLDKPSTEGQESQGQQKNRIPNKIGSNTLFELIGVRRVLQSIRAVASQLVQGQGSTQQFIKLYQGTIIYYLLVVYIL